MDGKSGGGGGVDRQDNAALVDPVDLRRGNVPLTLWRLDYQAVEDVDVGVGEDLADLAELLAAAGVDGSPIGEDQIGGWVTEVWHGRGMLATAS